MGLLSAVSSVANIGASVAGTTMSLGKSAISIGKTVLSSKIGKIGLFAGVVALMNRNNSGFGSGLTTAIKDGFSGLFNVIKSTVGKITGKIGEKVNTVANITKEGVDQVYAGTVGDGQTLSEAVSESENSAEQPVATTEQSKTDTEILETGKSETEVSQEEVQVQI